MCNSAKITTHNISMPKNLLLSTYIGLMLLICCMYCGCAGRIEPRVSAPQKKPGPEDYLPGQKPYEYNGIWYYPLSSASSFVEDGIASWYGQEFHGRPTASGEPYNMYAMTAAHKTLPLGTYVKVTHLKNNKSIVVYINDRGPFVAGRIIDLSYDAALKLDMFQSGTAPVRIEAVQPVTEQRKPDGEVVWEAQSTPVFRYGTFMIQVAAFQTLDNAFTLKQNLSKEYGTVLIRPLVNHNGSYYRVQVGPFKDLYKARDKTASLRQQGFTGAFVVAMEE